MKYLSMLFVGVVIMALMGCGGNEAPKQEEKKVELKKEETTQVIPRQEKRDAELVEKGKKLFQEKTCATCHLADKKIVGPAIKEITAKYNEKGASIVAFLQSKSDPIVDTDPGQVAVMKANIDGFVKELKEEELKALEAYMYSVK